VAQQEFPILEANSGHTQIFDYGDTVIEKRAILYKRLLPSLEIVREGEGIDLSKVVYDASSS